MKRDKIKNILSLGTKHLLFREYIIVQRYNLKKININDNDYLKVLYQTYNWLLIKKPMDKAMYLYQLDNLVLSFGNDIHHKYLSNRRIWKFFQHIKNVIKYIFNDKIYNEMRILYKIIMRYLFCDGISIKRKSTKTLSDNSSIITNIDLNKKREQGIINASKYLLDKF